MATLRLRILLRLRELISYPDSTQLRPVETYRTPFQVVLMVQHRQLLVLQSENIVIYSADHKSQNGTRLFRVQGERVSFASLLYL